MGGFNIRGRELSNIEDLESRVPLGPRVFEFKLSLGSSASKLLLYMFRARAYIVTKRSERTLRSLFVLRGRKRKSGLQYWRTPSG